MYKSYTEDLQTRNKGIQTNLDTCAYVHINYWMNQTMLSDVCVTINSDEIRMKFLIKIQISTEISRKL